MSKRGLVVFTLLVLVFALVGGQAIADPPHPATGADGTHNCDDFASQAEAQSYFESTGGNDGPEQDLDRDDDGTACEDSGLPATGTSGGAIDGDSTDGDSGTPTPSRIETGGGYCATHDC